MLLNLVGNAVKFTPPGGRITVSARGRDGDVCFAVADTGPGIPTADRACVFDRFWRGKHGEGKKGAGLGLAIAKGIVEAHRGRIWVESGDAGGTTFYFTLPVSEPAALELPE